MTTQPCSTSAAQFSTPAGFPLKQVLRGLILRVLKRRRRAAAIGRLEGMNDHMLADIGLTRDRVSGIIGDPHLVRWQRPPDLW